MSILLSLLFGCQSVHGKSEGKLWQECDFFTALVAEKTTSYHQKNRQFPVTPEMQALAVKVMPMLFVHSEASRPIDFSQYLKSAVYVSPEGRELGKAEEVFAKIPAPDGRHCGSHLRGQEVAAGDAAPFYTQVFVDDDPGRMGESWTWVKFNYVFDWSGLAENRSGLATLGAGLTGGDTQKWHRFDLHTSVIIGVDPKKTAHPHDYAAQPSTHLGTGAGSAGRTAG